MQKSFKSVMLALALVPASMLGVNGSVLAQEQKAPVVASVVQSQVNINTADAQILSRDLKGIGPAKAQAIIDYRTEHGAFESIDELIEVKGIGVATLERLRPQLTLD